MKLALGCAFNLKEIFETFNNKRLSISSKHAGEINNGEQHKKKLAMKIFRDSVKLIFNDIIDNNVTFELPTRGRKSEVHMRKIDGEDFKKARQAGAFEDIDFLESNFSGYQLTLFLHNKNEGPDRIIPIHLSGELKQKVIDNTNKGMQYC